jgi:hypothetical protein
LSDGWDDFKRKYEESINSLKSLLGVTIYGSYNPKKEKDLLLSLKQILINEGYGKTVLVDDRKQQDSDPLEISKMCLLYSDVNFLIFTKQGKRFGLVRELAFIAEDIRMRPKLSHCVVFDKIVNNESSSIPPLSISDIKNVRIHRRTFKTVEELKDAIVSEAYWQLKSLSNVISSSR